MTYWKLVASISLLLIPTAWSAEIFPAAKFGKAELRYIETIPFVFLEGSPDEIGTQHAALVSGPGKELLDFPRRLFVDEGMEFFYPLAAQAGMSLLTNAPARYQQEIAAATKQAKLEPQVFAVANTLLELRRMGCSTLIVEPAKSATGGPLFGRNFDFPPFGVLDRYGLVFVIKPTGKHAFASVSYPGLMGVISGMNDAGLCVATLDVYESGDGSSHFNPLGVPLTLVFRQILEECTSVDDAEALLKKTHATTQANLAVCDRDTAAVFEITPKQVARRNAANATLPCTNHFRMPGLAVNEECWRYDRLQAAIAKPSLTVADVHHALHAANQGEFTLQTMVFEPRKLVLHLAMGTPPSSQYPLRRLDIKSLLSSQKRSD
jgi:isopenicillin-N N-acyltransferase-like protein